MILKRIHIDTHLAHTTISTILNVNTNAKKCTFYLFDMPYLTDLNIKQSASMAYINGRFVKK